MTPEMRSEVISAAVTEIEGMLDEHIIAIDRSMQSAMADSDPMKVFKYPVSLGIVIEPVAEACKVTAKISYSVKHSDESIGKTVDPNQMKMDLDTDPEEV